MKPKTFEAFIYNREAFLKKKLEREFHSKTAHRLQEVKYLKSQLQAMLKEMKNELH
jgi:hypothetical protein